MTIEQAIALLKVASENQQEAIRKIDFLLKKWDNLDDRDKRNSVLKIQELLVYYDYT